VLIKFLRLCSTQLGKNIMSSTHFIFNLISRSLSSSKGVLEVRVPVTQNLILLFVVQLLQPRQDLPSLLNLRPISPPQQQNINCNSHQHNAIERQIKLCSKLVLRSCRLRIQPSTDNLAKIRSHEPHSYSCCSSGMRCRVVRELGDETRCRGIDAYDEHMKRYIANSDSFAGVENS